MTTLTRSHWLRLLITLVIVTVVCVTAGLLIGPQRLHWDAEKLSTESAVILWKIRLPRVLLGLLVGMALGSAGTTFQALLRNPLADPYILGVSGGAALGSVLGVILHMPFLVTALLAFTTSLATMALITWAVGRNGARNTPHTLLLTGVIFNAFAFALIMLVHAVVSMQDAHAILFLLIGSLETVQLGTVALVAMVVIPGVLWLTRQGQAMNALCLGDDTAHSLGIDVARMQRRTFIVASIIIGAVVAVSGLIGFVGLFIPHIVRLIWGSDHRLVVPASGLLGGGFLVLADAIARSVLTQTSLQTELPVGVITALIGGPVFILLLRREMRA